MTYATQASPVRPRPRARRRALAIACVGTAAQLALAGCGKSSGGGSGSGGGVTTLTETDYYEAAPQNTQLPKVLDECGAQVGVKVVHQQVPREQFMPKLLQQASSRSMPDLALIDNPDLQQLAATGGLVSLSQAGPPGRGDPDERPGQGPDRRGDRAAGLPPRRDRRRGAARGARALLVARVAPLRGRRRRSAPDRTALRGLRGRADLRPRPARARSPGPEGHGARTGPAQRRGLRPVRPVQPGLRAAVEQPGGRARRVRRERHAVGRRPRPAARLLADRGRQPGGRHDRVRRGGRVPVRDAGVGLGVLAEQAALPGPGRAAGGRPRVRPARAAVVSARHRLPALAASRRLGLRRRGLARPARHGRGAAGAGGRAGGVGVALCQPSVSPLSENYAPMRDAGMLIAAEGGAAVHAEWPDDGTPSQIGVAFYDATDERARAFVAAKLEANYYKLGIRAWWLDACEPEIQQPYGLSYAAGPGSEVANLYPREHTRGVYEHLRALGEPAVLSLVRSAWAGSQRYGAALWSGDIPATFPALADSVRAGLNVALSGIAWWTTDIGGFHGGDPDDEAYRELMVRWFQFGAFCPLFRLHGHREPRTSRGPIGDGGGPNEVWSYGPEAYEAITGLMRLRERLRPYIHEHLRDGQRTGIPLMRPLLLAFPDDPAAWEVEDQFLFGPDVLVAPVTEFGARERRVYLPAGAEWTHVDTGRRYAGGASVTVDAPLDRVPLFVRGGAEHVLIPLLSVVQEAP